VRELETNNAEDERLNEIMKREVETLNREIEHY